MTTQHVGLDTDEYAIGLDWEGQPIYGDAGALLSIIAPSSPDSAWGDCLGQCLDTDPGLGDPPTDADFEALFSIEGEPAFEPSDDFPMSLEYEDLAGVDDFANEESAQAEAESELGFWNGGV